MDLPAYEELFKEIKNSMWWFGVPYGYRIQLRFIFCYVAIVIMLSMETLYLISSPENFLEVTELAPCTCCGILTVLKISPIVYHRRKIFNLIENLGGMYSEFVTNPTNRDLVKKDIVLLKVLIKYFFILNMILISVYNFSSLGVILYVYLKTNTFEFILPYPVVAPFPTDTWPTWFIIYLYSVICGFICVLFYATVDALYCVLTSQICNHLATISNELQYLDETNVHCLKNLVTKHQYVLKLSEDLEDIFKLPNLFNVMVGSLEICGLGFNLTMGELTQVLKCLLFFISVILQILMMSVFGEKLIGESTKVADAAFNCKWYDMDHKSKQIILIIMTRSQKPQQLTAYNFSVISYGTFTKIISTSWSYFTILRTVYTPE